MIIFSFINFKPSCQYLFAKNIQGFIHCKPIPCNENRVSPVKFSHREIPVTKTGVPAMRPGVPCNENRFFPAWKTSQGKPCSGPVLALYSVQGCNVGTFNLDQFF